jgi:hypothetical protein
MDEETVSQSRSKRPWERVLYKQQAYPDNFTPVSFLKNVRIQKGARIFRKRLQTNPITSP